MLLNFILFVFSAGVVVVKTLNAVPAKAHVATIAAVSFQNGKRFSARAIRIAPRHPSAMETKLNVQSLHLKRTTLLNATRELRCVCSRLFYDEF